MKNESLALFESASVPKAFLALTIPTVLSKVVTMLYNLVDTWFVASTNNTSLVAAVSLCLPVLSVMGAIGDVWGVGGSSLISRLFGQGKREDAKKASALCFYGALACGVIVCIVMLILETPIMRLLGAKTETLYYATVYYRILAVGSPVIVLSVVPMHLLRTEGLSKESMIGSTVGAVMHIIMVPLLMFKWNMGIAGAALATVAGYVFNVVVYVWFILRKCQLSTISIQALRPDLSVISPIVSIGIPSSLMTLMQSVAMTLTNRCLLLYGTEQVAAYGIALKLGMLVAMLQIGFAFGAQPMIGYSYAKKDHTRFKEILKFNYGFMVIVSLAGAFLLWIFAPHLMGAFTEDNLILTAGVRVLRWQMLGVVFTGIILVSTTVFRAAGKSKEALLLALSRQGIIYAAVLILANAFWGYSGVIAAQPVSDVLTTIMTVFLLKSLFKRDT